MSAVFDVVREAGPQAIVARARLELLFDPGTFKPVRTEVGDGVLSGSGRVNGRVVCAWSARCTPTRASSARRRSPACRRSA
jgi:acetyl-CoA carboxylase carboxyltransferase component